jgi:hypothetical protein
VYALVSDMLKGAISHPAGAKSLHVGRALLDVVGDLRRLGARFRSARLGGSTVDDLHRAVKAHPNSVAVFGAHWKQWNAAKRASEPVGHAMCAYVDSFGRLHIGDRSQAIVRTLQELEDVSDAYKGMSTASIGPDVIFVDQARYLTVLGEAPGIGIPINATIVKQKDSRGGRR